MCLRIHRISSFIEFILYTGIISDVLKERSMALIQITYITRWELEPNKKSKLHVVVEWKPAKYDKTAMLNYKFFYSIAR